MDEAERLSGDKPISLESVTRGSRATDFQSIIVGGES